jgi:hypothetical protein
LLVKIFIGTFALEFRSKIALKFLLISVYL